MSRKINILTACYALFLILLFASGSLGGMLSELVYYAAFIIPMAIALYITRGDSIDKNKYLTADKNAIKFSSPLIFPTVSAVMLLSYLTALLIFALTGRTNDVELGTSFLLAIVNHALVPAIFEEALFRYIPMRLLAGHSKRGAVLVSAFFFALVHHDLFSIPYAFAAGVIFMAIDLACDSVFPSVIIHFINNAISVSLIFSQDKAVTAAIYTVLGLLTLLSLLIILLKRADYKSKIKMLTENGEKFKISLGMIIFALVTLSIAVINLI